MPSIQEIQRRTKAVSSTSQITKAMELVSATKMRRSQEIALSTRPYAVEVLRLLAELTNRTPYLPALMKPRTINKTAVVLVASDRGLAGSFNANVFRFFEKWLMASDLEPGSLEFVAVGKKSEDFLKRKNLTIIEAFKNFGDYVELGQVRPLSQLIIKKYLAGEWDQVLFVSTNFKTTLKQEVALRELLPINAEKVKESIKDLVPEYGRYADTKEPSGTQVMNYEFEYLIEPDAQAVLDSLAPRLVEIAIYDIVLEANASEHSARMVAMKNASDNAKELINDLTLEFNKIRQAAITREISEIISGAEALK